MITILSRALNPILLRKVGRDLLQLRLQVGAAAVLVACGVALLCAALNSWHALVVARDSFYGRYRFADLFVSFKRAPRSEVDRLARLRGVRAAEGRIQARGQIRVPGLPGAANGLFLSLPDIKNGRRSFDVNGLHRLQGFFPNRPEQVCLHVAYARAQGLVPGSRLLLQIEGKRLPVQVSCVALSPEHVYAVSPEAPLPLDREFGVVWLDRRALEGATGMADAWNEWSARVDPLEGERLVRDIETRLVSRGVRPIVRREDQSSNRLISDEIREQQVVAIFFPLIFLGVSAFLIHVMTTRLLALHRAQIGTLKSMGYQDLEIAIHYLIFTGVMPLLGFLPGVGLGAWLGTLLCSQYERFFRFPEIDFHLGWESLVISFLASLAAGAVGGMFSVWQALRLRPAEAMRPVLPVARFQLRKRRSPHGSVRLLMVFRNLWIGPVRLMMTWGGLCLAIAILVMGRSWTDLIDELVLREFSVRRREEVTVLLNLPVRSSGLLEVLSKPGVLEVQGVQSFAARVRYQRKIRELPLVAIDGRSPLRTSPDIVQGAGPETSTRGQGVWISDSLAKDWGVRVGDRLSLEFLNRALPERIVRVQGMSQDFMGKVLWVERTALRDWLREAGSQSQVLLRTDGRSHERILNRLRNAPRVASVISKRSLLRGFRGTVAAVLQVSSWMISGFALAICVGIIINSVRVSWSERLWELCSLRVLGFERGPVFFVFWSEVALQAGAAILPGSALGFWLVKASLDAIHTESIGFPVVLRTSTYVRAALLFLGVLGLSIGFVWRRIQRMNLADSLKARD